MHLGKKILVLIALFCLPLVLLSGYVTYAYIQAQNTLDKNFVRSFENKCGANPHCTMNISEVTPFPWDTVYVFEAGETVDMESVIGIPVPLLNEMSLRTVFLNEGRIVYATTLPQDEEGNYVTKISYDIPQEKRYKAYTNETATIALNEHGRLQLFGEDVSK